MAEVAALAPPYGYRVEGAGSAEVDGLYVRDGEYGGAPLFKKGRLWLLRYRIPSSGNLWWYIADKDSLDKDDGDMYRIRCAEPRDEGLPPTRANWLRAKDGRNPAPRVVLVASEPEAGGRAAPRAPLPAHLGFVQALCRMLWRAMAAPRAAPRAALPPLGGGAPTPTGDGSRSSELHGTAAVLEAMRERGFCGDAETRAEGWGTTEGNEAEMRARLLSKLAELLDALRPPIALAVTPAAPPSPPAPATAEESLVTMVASNPRTAASPRAVQEAMAPAAAMSAQEITAKAQADAAKAHAAAPDATRPAAFVHAEGDPGGSRALVLKAWVAVASHGVRPDALRRLIAEASAGYDPTAAALLAQLHAMHVASILPFAGHNPPASAPHTHGPGGLAPSLTAPVGEFQLEGTAAAAAAAAAERASSSEPAAFAEYAGLIIDECSRRVLAAAEEGAAPGERDRDRGHDSGHGADGTRGGGQGARVALRAGAWLHDEPVAALLPSLLLSMAGAPSPPPAAVLLHDQSASEAVPQLAAPSP